MPKNYEVELAKHFKSLKNPPKIGPVIGVVITPPPNLQISILDGSIILYADQLYINDSLLDDYEREYQTKTEPNEYGEVAKIKFKSSLKPGDLVKVSPAEGDQVWFLDYKIKAGE